MKEKIIKLIEDVLKVPAGTITEDTMIEDVEQWDSLAHVMIIGQLEEELGVSIPLDEAIDLKGMRELLEKGGLRMSVTLRKVTEETWNRSCAGAWIRRLPAI